MDKIDYTEVERPVEPAFSNEDPEGWVEVLAWEEARADKLEKEVERLNQEKQQLIGAGYETNKTLRQENEKLREVLHSLIENSDCQTMESHGYYYTAYILDEDDINKAKKILNK